ncbi:MAG: ThiF family adenylyltransferase, partial [Dehalococcoidia bacterium]|nr:ThiF family adenylyltransferase [Dehalococcoidia bacterium]
MYLISNINLASNLPIVVVGCGGTGSLVAEGLCRLFLDRPEVNVVLVDMDRVEAHNIARQNFHPGEVGRFKTEALAQRLSQAYGREISYSTSPWSNGVYKDIFMQQPAPNMVALSSGLIIGCLDNAPARAAVLETLTTGFT